VNERRSGCAFTILLLGLLWVVVFITAALLIARLH
jgi:hypothetical protein